LDIDTFFSIPISVRDGTVLVEGKQLGLDGRGLSTKTVLNGEVG
jgi:hypothetical protein